MRLQKGSSAHGRAKSGADVQVAKGSKLARACFLLVLIFSSDLALGRLVRSRSAREGVLDAAVVAIVRQKAADVYEIEEVFWGNAEAGDSIELPGFKLYTKQEEGPDLIDPISSGTRILFFLQHKKDEPNSWEAEEALSKIVGKDLGRRPKPWLDWYQTHRPTN